MSKTTNKKSKQPRKTAKTKNKFNIFKWIKELFHPSAVHWKSWHDTWRDSVKVMAITILSTGILAGADAGFGALLRLVS